MNRSEPVTRYEIDYGVDRRTIIVHPTNLTKVDIKKIKIYLKVLEELSVLTN